MLDHVTSDLALLASLLPPSIVGDYRVQVLWCPAENKDIGFRFSLRENMGRKKRGVIELRDFNIKAIAEEKKTEEDQESSVCGENDIKMDTSIKNNGWAMVKQHDNGATDDIKTTRKILANVDCTDLKAAPVAECDLKEMQKSLLKPSLNCSLCDFAVSNHGYRERKLLMHQARRHFKTKLDSVLPHGCQHCPECSFKSSSKYLLQHWVTRHDTLRNWMAAAGGGGLATEGPGRSHEVGTKREYLVAGGKPLDLGRSRPKVENTESNKSLRLTIKVLCQFCCKKLLASSYYNHKKRYCIPAKVAAAKAFYNVDMRRCYVQIKKKYILLNRGLSQSREKLSLPKKKWCKNKTGKELSVQEPTCEYERIRAINIAERKALWDTLDIDECIKDAKKK